MEQVKRQMMKLLDEIIQHGQGKIEIDVGPYGSDKTSILIICGKGYRFIVDRFTVDKLDD